MEAEAKIDAHSRLAETGLRRITSGAAARRPFVLAESKAKNLAAMLAVIFVVAACYANKGLDARAYAELDALAGKNGCSACHSLENNGTGPSWREVARKYSGQATYEYAYKKYSLEDGLVKKASLGGRHDWGETIMRGNDPDSLDQKGVRQKDIRKMVRLILRLPPDR